MVWGLPRGVLVVLDTQSYEVGCDGTGQPLRIIHHYSKADGFWSRSEPWLVIYFAMPLATILTVAWWYRP